MRRRRTLILLAILAVTWRGLAAGAALLEPDPGAGAHSGVALAYGAMGLGFLACGWIAFSRAGTAASALFALYGSCQAIHWGGPIELPQALPRTALQLLWLIATMLGTSALLHFALHFPTTWRFGPPRVVRAVLYGPVALAALLALPLLLAPGAAAAGGSLRSALLVLEALQGNLFGVGALVVVLFRFARADARARRSAGLGVLCAGLLAGALLPAATQVVLGGGADLASLLYLLIPLAIVHAILRETETRTVPAEGSG